MRRLALGIMLMAMALGVVGPAAAAAEPQASQPAMDTMTVVQLEAAGDIARAQKDYEQAVKYFETALRKDRTNAILYNKLGLTELKMGNLSAAQANFQKATKRNSKFADAVNNLGAVEYMQRNFNSAAKHFKKALALDETRATFHVNLGAAWFGQKKMERAIAEYSRALELDPMVLESSSRTGVAAQIANPEERAKYSYLLAKVYAKQGNTERCLQCLRKAKEEGYRDLAKVYEDEEFTKMRQDTRMAEIVSPPQR